MLAAMMCSLLLVFQSADRVDVEQLVRLVETQSAVIRDLSFLYEGTNRWVGPQSIIGMDVMMFGEQFQGAYLYRRNDAAMKDVYLKKHDNAAQLRRLKVVFLKSGIRQMMIDANEKPLRAARSQPPSIGGSMHSLNRYGSPNLLFRTWLLLDLAKHSAERYRFVGWDSIDGHNCIRFRLIADDKQDHEGFYDEYWVDLERTANVLRVDSFDAKKLRARLDSVQLQEVSTVDGKTAWVPVQAQLRGYAFDGQYYDNPVTEEKIAVVDGTILVNQGLPDAAFDVTREAGLPGKGELDRLRRQASESPLAKDFAARPSQSDRLDPVGARERLEKQLAEADHQAVMLEASAPSRESWILTNASQVVALVAGVCLIGTALVLRRRAA